MSKTVQVFITSKKSRIRVYNNNICYLQPGQQFEIQFNNTTGQYYLAMINLNGKEISKSGLVIRPYQHIYLDRYLDENCRFLFSNIQISKNNSKVARRLGQIKVTFYKQKDKLCNNISKLWTYYPQWMQYYKYPKITYTGDPLPYTIQTTNNSGTFKCYNINDNISDLLSCNVVQNITKGIIEKGSQSSTHFVQSYEQFNQYSQFQIIYILQPIQNKTIDEVKHYCINCGRRIRQNENFCPKCGNKN